MNSLNGTHIYARESKDKLRAMITHDVSKRFGGSLESAAHAIVSNVFVVVATHDRVVTPEPARKFAQLIGCNVLELEGDCGHGAFSCEMTRVSEALEKFFRR